MMKLQIDRLELSKTFLFIDVNADVSVLYFLYLHNSATRENAINSVG